MFSFFCSFSLWKIVRKSLHEKCEIKWLTLHDIDMSRKTSNAMLWFRSLAWPFPVDTSYGNAPIRFGYSRFQIKSNIQAYYTVQLIQLLLIIVMYIFILHFFSNMGQLSSFFFYTVKLKVEIKYQKTTLNMISQLEIIFYCFAEVVIPTCGNKMIKGIIKKCIDVYKNQRRRNYSQLMSTQRPWRGHEKTTFLGHKQKDLGGIGQIWRV